MNLKLIRLKQGMSQTQLADRLNVKQPRIAELESKAGNPRLDTLRRLAKVLKCKISELVE